MDKIKASDPDILGFTQSQNGITMDKAEEIKSKQLNKIFDDHAVFLNSDTDSGNILDYYLDFPKFIKAAEQIRREALEEAAKECEKKTQMFRGAQAAVAEYCAKAIRNLKGKSE